MTRVKELASAILDGNNDITFSGPHASKFLAGYVSSGTYAYANETVAKDACTARNDCNGVTQEPKSYTLRAGSTLSGSSTGENSWKKNITFTSHAGMFLAGYVQSGTYVYANETLAKDACTARVDCNGVTQEPKSYTLRAGSTLSGSSTGENSWKKNITFTSHAGKALAGYVSSGTYVYANETAAKDACTARVDCNGVTQEPTKYTLRAGSTLTGSSKGEVSWLITRPESVLDLVAILGNIRKVRVQLEGTGYLHMSEVQVFDQNGLNLALNKRATQSSTNSYPTNVLRPALNAVNGNLTDFGSMSGLQAGK